MSPDSRYCPECYEFLTNEAELITGWNKPLWVPRQDASCKAVGRKSKAEKPTYPRDIPSEVLQRANQPLNHVLQKYAREPQGRPMKEVPVERIKELSRKLGVRDIARELNIHHSMVSRVLSGKRN